MKRVLVVLLLCATSIFGQSGTGGLKGRVSDETGALIVGATVTATGAAGKTKTVVTNNDGSYSLTGLAPGKYTYKFIIDGNWIVDPANPNTEDDERGLTNSVLVVKPN